MTRREALEQIREAVLAGRYVLTAHAYQEMYADNVTVPDVETALLRGTMNREYGDDPRGPRYHVVGTGTDLLTSVAVVVRLTNQGRVLIITVFRLDFADD